MEGSGETSFIVESCVRGYHVYESVWPNPVLGESLACARERGNTHDIFAVAVRWRDDSTIVGHVPREMSCVCNLFIRDGGTLHGSVKGSRRYSHDIPEGGMEIPCDYIFSGSAQLTEKTNRRLKELQEKFPAIRIVSDCTSSTATTISLSPASKVSVVADTVCAVPVIPPTEFDSPALSGDTGSVWVKIQDITLKSSDKAIIDQGLELTDLHINCAQRLIKGQFPKLNGLKLSLLQSQTLKGSTTNAIQIFHINGNHWIVATTINSKNGKNVQVYDSAYSSLDHPSALLLKNFFRCSLSNIKVVAVQKQRAGSSDCGLHAIENAVAIAFGENPPLIKYDQAVMRSHLVECLATKKVQPFPKVV